MAVYSTINQLQYLFILVKILTFLNFCQFDGIMLRLWGLPSDLKCKLILNLSKATKIKSEIITVFILIYFYFIFMYSRCPLI